MSVAIVMGSDSDLPIMRQAAEALEEFAVEWEMRVLSAHRTPEETLSYARSAVAGGIQVIIAGAGGAAHLPGVIAAVTRVPVIGVPIALPKLDGLDSLLSIVQMPKGVPVATVAVDNAANAAMLAVEIIALSDRALAKQLEEKRRKMAEEVEAKGRAIEGK